jgi:hypothetical protein
MWQDVNWVDVTQDAETWRIVVQIVIKLLSAQDDKNLFTGGGIIACSIGILLYGLIYDSGSFIYLFFHSFMQSVL